MTLNWYVRNGGGWRGLKGPASSGYLLYRLLYNYCHHQIKSIVINMYLMICLCSELCNNEKIMLFEREKKRKGRKLFLLQEKYDNIE